MTAAALLALGLLAGASSREGEAAPSSQELVFYNARLALRGGQPAEALKLWLLHNGLVASGSPAQHEEAFRSVVWAALGKLGLCQDGFPKDEGGAGLWPLALHNWTVSELLQGPPPGRPSPFEVFDVARQQRLVSLHDVLSSEELESVAFFRTGCVLDELTGFELGAMPRLGQDDRLATGRFLRALLVKALETVDHRLVEGTAVLEARLFDLDLVLVQLEAREARRQSASAQELAASLGVSQAGVQAIQSSAAGWQPTGTLLRPLLRSLEWPAREWLALSRPRRLALFAQVRRHVGTTLQHQRVALDVIDALVDLRAGEELEAWVGFFGATDTEGRAVIAGGERGARLLELAPQTGFRERAAIALQRGVLALEGGATHDALRAFAMAMAFADASREATAVRALSARWLSYVLSSFETTEDVIATVRALVPPQALESVLEDLAWRAALRADGPSFERAMSAARRGGAFEHRGARLRFLAQGKAGELVAELRASSVEEPRLTMGFVRQLVERLEKEEAQVRLSNAALLGPLAGVLGAITEREGGQGGTARVATELTERLRGMREGLGRFEGTAAGRARALSPQRETFAGSLRLAPVDPLPWPFSAPEPAAPSVFLPLQLRPVEWRDKAGALVFGWRVSE